MKFSALFIALLFSSSALADSNINYGVPYTLVTEKDAKSFAIAGVDQKAISAKFGPPNMTYTGKNAMGVWIEVWTYLVDPRAARIAHSNYCGFEVFFKDKKVTDVGIILGGK
jgi:hypothetical protein